MSRVITSVPIYFSSAVYYTPHCNYNEFFGYVYVAIIARGNKSLLGPLPYVGRFVYALNYVQYFSSHTTGIAMKEVTWLSYA